jgi:ABC-type sugar transport system ATPase subunit
MRTEEDLGTNVGAVATVPAEETGRPTPEIEIVAPAPDEPEAEEPGALEEPARELVFELRDVEVRYSGHTAIRDVALDVAAKEITAFIGPSGCGKTTVLRCLNRMHDITPGAEVLGSVRYHGENLYGPKVDPAEVRRRIGMVFQKPNPFPKSIYENVAYGVKINGYARKKGELDEIVEKNPKLRDQFTMAALDPKSIDPLVKKNAPDQYADYQSDFKKADELFEKAMAIKRQVEAKAQTKGIDPNK